MKFYSITTMAAALVLLSSSAFAGIVVIVHPSNTNNIDAASIKQIFTGKASSYDDSSEAIPLNLGPKNAATDEFNDKVLRKSAKQLKAYWSKKMFTGSGMPPKEIGSDAEMVKLIATNPNLIGYVSAEAVDASVRVVQSF